METRPHKEEMIRFANSEVGTAVWWREKTFDSWKLIKNPLWSEDYVYVVDNKYAELRKKSVDEDRAIQMYNTIDSKWETPTFNLDFSAPIESYRLEPKEDKFNYPIYKRCIYKANFYTGCVVEFTGETEGVIVKDTERTREFDHHIRCRLDNWIPHTDTNAWEDYDYVEPTYYYQWEILLSTGKVKVSDFMTNKYAEKFKYEKDGWRKIESSKRTWED